ncbi:MAG TPA: hypothetical protein VJG49_01965 [Candidatus Nanoarchaeia archaeon]|nr:hypothetical protein [Candidatus Nanoarchaeia archaeon]
MEIHYEKDLVINGREIKYKGLFRYDELFSLINAALVNQGYEKREKKTEELVTEEGRRTYVELRPYKIKSSYVTLMIKIKIIMDKVTETVKEYEGGKKKFQQGDLNIIFDSWILSDYRSRWGMKPFVFFWKGIIKKLLYRWPLEAGFRDELVDDTVYVHTQIKQLLRSYQPEAAARLSDEEVRRRIAEEMESADFSS